MLRASCPLQYEAVMDRVQKSKLSLYKKTMEVSARVHGLAGPRAQGVPGTQNRATPEPGSMTHTAACPVPGAVLGAKAPHRPAQALPFLGS